ncbi:copper chaperone PCu(A)C [Leucobacter albus]|uniref:Copper chaperone PCu(A)C n=1 Tax=Leucobacter albus TaxID=272210 RepID=A0ABW3TIE9_9MICO
MFITHRTQRSRRAAVGLAGAAAAFALVLAGCSSSSAPENSAQEQSAPAAETGVTASDMWVKATAPDVQPGEAMSGVFGTLENHGDEDLVITSLKSDVAGVTELHEVVDGKMRKIEGDVTVPAGGKLQLEPGANHIMLMDIQQPLSPGDDVTITLTFSDGSTLEIVALVKDTSGANESYEDIEMDHGDMDMSEGMDMSGDADAMSHG